MAHKNHLSICRFIILVMLIFWSGNSYSQAKRSIKNRSTTQEQSVFSAEGKIRRPAKLPASILKQLASYDNGQLDKCQLDKSMRKANMASHFAASMLSVNADGLADMIVQAQTACFMGAHNTTFWIFTGKPPNSGHSYELIFDIAVDFLKVLKTVTNGYRDLETSTHTAIELYTVKWQFDGNKYQKGGCTVTDLNNNVRAVECNP